MHRRFVKLINKNVRDSLFSENKPFCKISSSVFIESSEIFYGKNGRLNTTFLLKSMTLVDSLNWNKFHFCRQYCRHNQVRMNSKYFQGHFHPKTGKLEVKKKRSQVTVYNSLECHTTSTQNFGVAWYPKERLQGGYTLFFFSLISFVALLFVLITQTLSPKCVA